MRILASFFASIVLACLAPSTARAQCNGQFPAGTICGNPTGAQTTPRQGSPSVFGIPTLSANGTWTGFNTFSPTAGTSPAITINTLVSTKGQGLVINQTTPTGGDGSANPYAFNGVTVGGFGQSSYGIYLQRNLAAASWIWPQTAVTALAEVLGNPSGSTAANDVVAVQGFARGSVPVTLGNNVNLFAGNFFTEVVASATGYQFAIGSEMDVGIRAGGTAVRKIGQHVVSFGPVAGTGGQDTAYNIVKFDVSSAPWKYGFAWQQDAFDTTSTIIGTVTGFTTAAAKGIDFTGVTFSGNAIASAGFTVSSVGRTSIGGGNKLDLRDTTNTNLWSLDYATTNALTITRNNGGALVVIDTLGGVRANDSFWAQGFQGVTLVCTAMPTQMTIKGGLITSTTGGTCS